MAWLFLLLLFHLWGCTESIPENTIRFGLATAPTNLDPRHATDATSARINRLLYSRLIDFSENATPIPALATWEKLTPTHYRFTLREPHPIFHHGSPITATDIKATYLSILDPKSSSPQRSLLQHISRIDTPSPSTVDFVLTHPDPLFPSYLIIGILPANLIEANHSFHSQPIGSGPFIFQERPDDTRLILKRRNDGQRIEFVRIPDPTVRTLKLLAGEIHLLQNDLPPELVEYLVEQSSLSLTQRQGSKFSYLGFNHQDPIVGQDLVRQAIAHAINREQIIRFMLGKRARLAPTLFPQTHWLGTNEVKHYDYDPPRAKALLREAGFDELRRPTLTYKTSTDPFRLRLATIIQDQLQQVGIDVYIQSHDWGTFYGDIKAGRFQMYSLAWVGLHTPDIFRQIFHSQAIPPRGMNRGRFRDKITDELIATAEKSTDRTQQQARYQKLQQRLSETLPYIPLWFEDQFTLSTKSISGYTLHADGHYDGLNTVQWTSPTKRPTLLTQQTSP